MGVIAKFPQPSSNLPVAVLHAVNRAKCQLARNLIRDNWMRLSHVHQIASAEVLSSKATYESIGAINEDNPSAFYLLIWYAHDEVVVYGVDETGRALTGGVFRAHEFI